uniref:pentapeptide repeat-containing protein n=1 Tax=Clostridium sp. TaxID=1506 RepID=UPI00260A24E3
LKRDEELSIKNEVVAMKVKGKYRDVYIGTDYKLDNLIYVDDNKNLYRIKENIEYDKSLYVIKEQEITKELEGKSVEGNDWQLSDRDLDNVSFNVMKNTIEELMKENYGDFVRAIISIESGIEDLDILDNIHEKYMDSDFKLINDKFEDLKNEIEREKLDVRDEKKEKEIWRKIREHEEWIKSNGLRGQQLNLENENLSGMRLINLDLRDANFKGADMTQCVIFADLRGADLTGVKINNSEWIGSNINNVTIEANKLNLIEYQMEQEKDVHLASMDKLKTKTKEKEIKM